MDFEGTGPNYVSLFEGAHVFVVLTGSQRTSAKEHPPGCFGGGGGVPESRHTFMDVAQKTGAHFLAP